MHSAPTDTESRKHLFRRPTRRHVAVLVSLVVVHLALIAAIVFTTPLVHLDWWIMVRHPDKQAPEVYTFLNNYVVLGQRFPSAALAGSWLLWRSVRQRSWRPLILMAIALLLLNVTVGAVKLGLGRLGPHYNFDVWTSGIFLGGDIMPSGHTANAVVTWGVVAYLAVHFRRTAAAIAAFLALTIGLTTVYLGTHWISDVVDGWVAGLLVLALVPLFEPAVTRADTLLKRVWRRFRSLLPGGRGRRTEPAAGEPAAEPVPPLAHPNGARALSGSGRGRHARRPLSRSSSG